MCVVMFISGSFFKPLCVCGDVYKWILFLSLYSRGLISCERIQPELGNSDSPIGIRLISESCINEAYVSVVMFISGSFSPSMCLW